MSGYHVPVEEQETVISYIRAEKCAYIYTSDTNVINKLDKLCETLPGYYKFLRAETVQGQIVAKDYILTDKKMVKLRSTKRTMTEEQKQIAADRLKQMRMTRANDNN